MCLLTFVHLSSELLRDVPVCAAAMQVSGTMDPREGRIVLHGWFTSPSPFFSGGQ